MTNYSPKYSVIVSEKTDNTSSERIFINLRNLNVEDLIEVCAPYVDDIGYIDFNSHSAPLDIAESANDGYKVRIFKTGFNRAKNQFICKFDRYLAIVAWAKSRYTRNGSLVISIGGNLSRYKRIESMAASRYLLSDSGTS